MCKQTRFVEPTQPQHAPLTVSQLAASGCPPHGVSHGNLTTSCEQEMSADITRSHKPQSAVSNVGGQKEEWDQRRAK